MANSTLMFSGINPEGRNSSKVLRPPGGGSSLGPFHCDTEEEVSKTEVVQQPQELVTPPIETQANILKFLKLSPKLIINFSFHLENHNLKCLISGTCNDRGCSSCPCGAGGRAPCSCLGSCHHIWIKPFCLNARHKLTRTNTNKKTRTTYKKIS